MAEISLSTGLSFPTVSRVVYEMEKENELIAVGLAESSGGRRARRFNYNFDHMHGAAIFLEKTETKGIIFNCKGQMIRDFKFQGLLECTGTDCVDEIIILAKEITSTDPKIRSLSVGIPASVENGLIKYIPSYEYLQQLDLRSALEQELKLTVTVENDMNASILGYLGRARADKSKSYAYLYLGTNGPGLGLFVNNDIVRGGTFFAGEVSFMTIYNKQNFWGSLYNDDSSSRLDAISRLIVSVSALINPNFFVFSDLDLNQLEIDQIEEICAGYFPREHLPKLIGSKWSKDYLEGLKILSLKLMVNL